MSQRLKIYRQGKGQVISLLHGWGMNSSIFEPLVERLKTEFEVVRVDLPGHGQSSWSSDESYDDVVEQLAQVLPESIVVGWSMGGLYATRLAHCFPQQFKRLVLVSNNPSFVKRQDWSCAVDKSVFDDFSQDLINDWQSTIRRFVGLQLHGADNARVLIRQITELLVTGGKPDEQALRSGLKLLLEHDARAELKQLNQPVLVVLGERDALVPFSLARQLHRTNPRIRVECLAQSAHVPFVSHPEAFVDLLREFIESTPAG